jgi:preprotein translocase subunit SecF
MIHFMRFKWFYFLISSLVIIPGLVSLLLFGLKPSIDFTGGTLLELKFTKAIEMSKYEEIKSSVKEKGFEISSIQGSGENVILVRMKPITKDEAVSVKAMIAEKLEEMPEEVRFETVGPVLGQELIFKTLVAVLFGALFIMGYVAYVFKNVKFGVCAILAMFHDSLVLLGIFSLLGHFMGVEVDTLYVTAVLTILSFSVHDTVVVYDRIRESQKRLSGISMEEMANKAVTETLSRSLNNSLTIIFMLMALFLLGGETIKWFVVALLIGTISGTYSSTFTAVPLLVVWDKISNRKRGGEK